MSKIAEQITAFEQKRASLVAANEAIMAKAAEEGTTLDKEQKEAFDGNSADIKEIDDHLKRLRDMEKATASTAKPIDGQTLKTGSESRVPAQIKAAKPEPGIRLARFARSIGLAHKTHRDVMQVAEDLYGQRDPEVVGMIKAAVIAVNTTTDASLIGNEGGWADFVEFLRPQTIIGRFGQNGIPALRRVPFRVPLISQTGGGTGYWVGEGKAKPLTKPAFGRTELAPLKVANIAVATMEALRDSSPSAETLIRDDLAAALIVRMDTSFIALSNAGSAGVSPASITNGVTPIASSGNDADAVRVDVRAAMGQFIAANNALSSGVWLMSATRALALSTMVNALGQAEFPGITINGGTFFGLPVVVSEHITDFVVLVNASDIWVADDGGIAVDMSTEASLEMMDNPTGDSIASTPVAAELVSMFQTNSVAFRAERTINWARRRASGVAVIDDVAWGDPATSP
ncbi:phage major capsid protein [Devosia sp.]|uniref:phage major capsid protein n=1 Tax=Devosia sp. TaxID=1871048 RepID=UPI001B187A4D|nr:phage major capsid protein [Devosia sp.]MBO9589542.1 phage major capsid protein [Devosia sp.]